MGTKTSVDTAGFLPRGLRREDAAFYVGVSPATFDEMVKDGRMPQPKKVGKRTVNRRSNLTPYRRPILTPLSGGFWR